MSQLLWRPGDTKFFLVCLWPHLQPPNKQNAVAVQCYKCGGPNLFARDCRQPRGKSRRVLPEIRCYQCQQQGHVASRCPGKLGKGREAGTTLSPHKLEEVLPVMKVKVNGMDQIVLVLVPYPEDKLGPPKGQSSLIAVIQQNKQKVRSVLDYQELNDRVDPFTAHADICTEKLREWR